MGKTWFETYSLGRNAHEAYASALAGAQELPTPNAGTIATTESFSEFLTVPDEVAIDEHIAIIRWLRDRTIRRQVNETPWSTRIGFLLEHDHSFEHKVLMLFRRPEGGWICGCLEVPDELPGDVKKYLFFGWADSPGTDNDDWSVSYVPRLDGWSLTYREDGATRTRVFGSGTAADIARRFADL